MNFKLFQKILLLIVSLLSFNAYSYVTCTVPVDSVLSANSSGFHNFNEHGFTGGTVFIVVNPVNCSFRNGDTSTGSTTFLVMDKIDTADGLKKTWVSLLIAAQTSGKKIAFHATNKKNNSRGFQALQPYFMGLVK